MAGEVMDHRRQVIGGRLDILCKEGVDFSSQQQNHREVVKEKQEDHQQTCRASYLIGVAHQKVGDVEWEKQQVQLEQYCRYHGSKPTIAKANVLIGYDDVDGLEQDPRNTQRDEDTEQAKEEATARELVDDGVPEYDLEQGGNRGSKHHGGRQNDEYQEHDDGHDVLLDNGARAGVIDNIKIPLHAHEEPRASEESEKNGDDGENTDVAFEGSESDTQEIPRCREDALQVADKLLFC